MIITRTPFRVSLFGGGSDHPEWFSENRGRVLSFTIDKYCYVIVRELPRIFSHNFKISYSEVEVPNKVDDIKHPVVRESIRKYANEMRLELQHTSDLPARSGVGSSSAFTVGVINALLAMQSKTCSPSKLADLAINLEKEVLKESVGWQDQIACALGGINVIEFDIDMSWTAKPIQISDGYRESIESRSILIYTGIERFSSDISQYFLEELEKKSELIREVMDMAHRCSELLQYEGNLDEIGHLLDESWKLKKLLNPHTSNPMIDKWYSLAIDAGALGGKILGAGGGGFFLFWLKENGADEFLAKFKLGTPVFLRLDKAGTRVLYK